MDRFDALMVVGLFLLAVGSGLIYFPLALIVGGIGCMAIAIVGARGNVRGNVASSGKIPLKGTQSSKGIKE